MLHKYITVNDILLLDSLCDSQQSQYITEKTMGFTKYSDCASCKHHSNVLCL